MHSPLLDKKLKIYTVSQYKDKCIYIFIIITIFSALLYTSLIVFKNNITLHEKAGTIGILSSQFNNNNTNNVNHTEIKYLYIIRHCEKVRDRNTGLSLEGTAHSLCLVNYFKNFPLGKPNIIYAQTSKTYRSIATGIPIYTDFCNKMYSFWGNDNYIENRILSSLYEFDIVLLIAEHNFIPNIARKLGCDVCESWNNNPLAKHVDNSLFNVTWIMKFIQNKDKSITFSEIYVNDHNYIVPIKETPKNMIQKVENNEDNTACIKNYSYSIKLIYKKT